jgi:prepilin peptidase CpaA
MSASELASPILTALVRIGFIALMTAAALSDARSLRIPNIIPLALIALFVIACTAGLFRPLAPHLESFAIAALVGCFLFYRGIWGGGDAKLLAGLGLFLEPHDLFSLALVVAVAGGVVAALVLIEKAVKKQPAAHAAIPYGIALAAGGLNWCFTAG